MASTPAVLPVIIPMYNAADTVHDCVRSILEQRDPPGEIEVVVVDNNSTDASCKIVQAIDDSRVRLLHEPRQGAYCARNTGLRATSGDVVLFTDPDCIADPSWARAIVEPIAEGEAGAVLGRVLPAGRGMLLDAFALYEMHKERLIFAGESPAMAFGRTNNMAIRRDLLEEQGLFVEDARGGDTRFVQRAVERHGARVVGYAQDATVRHAEIASFRDHLRKVRIYAGTTGSGDDAIDVPTRRQRLAALRAACEETGTSVRTSVAVLWALTMEAFAWRMGRR